MSLRYVSPFVMWFIVIVGCAAVALWVPSLSLFDRNPAGIAVLAITFINWVYFFFGAVKANASVARSAAGVSRLVIEGVYSKVRHPIYSADIILAWGVFLCFPTLRMLCYVIWMSVVLLCWMRVEENAMERRFGEDYLNYKRSVPMVLPKF